VRALNLEALAARAVALCADRRLRIAVTVLGFAVVTALTVVLAHPSMFNVFRNYDDEGYMLTALKAFVNHGHLYDQVFTQYGPFYYELWGGLFSIFGIPVTHDSGRTVVMVVWVLAGLLFGLGTLKMTGNFLLGLGVQILSFSALGVLVNEPMHPVGLIGLLLAVIVLISTFVGEGRSRWAMGLLGAAVAALVLTKINVGFFALISVAFACAVSYQQLWGRRWPRIAIEAVFVLIPILLMTAKLDEGWARHYAIHVAVTALAVVIVLRANQPMRRRIGELRWLVGGFVLLAVLSVLIIIATGTSIHGLIDGVIKQPLRQSNAFTIAISLSRRLYYSDLLGLAAAIAYWYTARRRSGEPSPAWLAVTSIFAIVVGVTMAFTVDGQMLPFDANPVTGYQFTMLPFVWVALAVTVPGESRTPSFARLLLPLLATLQVLHAYPVAGSQTLLAAVLLVPTGALCVANGLRGLWRVIPEGSDRIGLAGLAVVATVILAWFTFDTYLKIPIHQARGTYHDGYALELPGSHDIRLGNKEEVELYEAVANGIQENCKATLMEPGMDSFYLWSEQEPPSYTATGWETLFDEEHQDKVIKDTESIPHLCLLRNPELAAGWGLGEGPLVKYLEHGFTPIGQWDDYELLRREGQGSEA
jgi:hypothetical protein